ncbi:MAG: hypothetical protein GY910_17080 [bacterium]|nr:hypothetical protein [Deltaproteobacteria bacterium]MCP4906691.1 hypothetical protein [bacterium]
MDHSRPLADRFLVTALAFALITLATACDSGTQEPDAPAVPVEFGAAGTATEPSGDSTGVPTQPRDESIAADRFPRTLPEGLKAEVPESFPSNIPIYPGAQAAQGASGEVKGIPRAGVQLLSNDAPTDIFGFYEDALKGNGWDITDAKNDLQSGTISATNDGCSTIVFVQASPKGGSDIFVLNECDRSAS